MVWNIVGGIYGSFVLGSSICPQHSGCARPRNGRPCAGDEWKERIAENPANNERFLDFDPDEFLKVMLRWLNAFVSKPGQTIPGVEDEMFDRIEVPTLIIRGGENDYGSPQTDIARKSAV